MSRKLASIRVKNLSFQFNIEKQVLEHVSFLVSPGEKVAIMGQNGAGKTTLCKILAGEINDYQGEVLIPAGVQLAYASQVMPEKFLSWSMQDYLFEAKNLKETFAQYFLVTELLAYHKSFDEVSLPQVSAEIFSELLQAFHLFLENAHLPELQVSEECAVELMCEIESHLENLKIDAFLGNQMLVFLKKSIDGEMVLSLAEFVSRFEIYFEFLLQKSAFQKYAKEHFSSEMIEIFGELQSQYEHFGGYDLEEKMREVLELVGLSHLDRNLRIELLSGGQKNRLILAHAVLKDPDILILDEPTNNLDVVSYKKLCEFVKHFSGTLLAISHDAEFLQHFVQKVLYVDGFDHVVREYSGTYENVKKEIAEQIDRERSKRAKIDRELDRKKDLYQKRSQQAQVYSGAGSLAASAKKMKEEIEKLEEQKKGGIKEDKAILPFLLPCEVIDESLMAIDVISRWNGEIQTPIRFSYQVEKGYLVLLAGENGTGKSWFLKECVAYAKMLKLAGTEVLPKTIFEDVSVEADDQDFFQKMAKKVWFHPQARIGYYSQDFSTLNFSHTVQQSMEEIHPFRYQDMRSILARFSFNEKHLEQKVGELSEGQKALLSFARLVFLEPNLLILDEPTNHVNFRHLPVIQDALKKYRGTVFLVCHDEHFLQNLPIAQVLDLRNGEKVKWKKWISERKM